MPPEGKGDMLPATDVQKIKLDCGRRKVLGGFMIHILRDGQQFGPYSLEEINAFLADGSLLPRIRLGTKARRSIPLTEVPGVALLAQPVSSPVATGEWHREAAANARNF